MEGVEKILMVRAYQPQASYRNPYTFFFAQSYPLPPPSTIRGMLGRATGRYYYPFKEVKIGVMGKYGGKGWEYTQMIKLLRSYPVPGDILVDVDIGGGNKDIGFLFNKEKRVRRQPVYREVLYDVELLLVIGGPSNIVEEIGKALRRPRHSLYLGRSDDILIIEDVNVFKVKMERRSPDVYKILPYARQYLGDDWGMYIKRREGVAKPNSIQYYLPVRIIFMNEKSDKEMVIDRRGMIMALRDKLGQKIEAVEAEYLTSGIVIKEKKDPFTEDDVGFVLEGEEWEVPERMLM